MFVLVQLFLKATMMASQAERKAGKEVKTGSPKWLWKYFAGSGSAK